MNEVHNPTASASRYHYDNGIPSADNETAADTDMPLAARNVTAGKVAGAARNVGRLPRSRRDAADRYRISVRLCGPQVTDAEVAMIEDLLFAAIAELKAKD